MFNFCEKEYNPNEPECKDYFDTTDVASFAYKTGGSNQCTPYSYDKEGLTDTAGTEIKTDDNVITGLVLTFSSTNDCDTGNNGKESFQVQINCPADVLDGKEKADIDHWSAPK